jgi:hypothetical protein
MNLLRGIHHLTIRPSLIIFLELIQFILEAFQCADYKFKNWFWIFKSQLEFVLWIVLDYIETKRVEYTDAETLWWPDWLPARGSTSCNVSSLGLTYFTATEIRSIKPRVFLRFNQLLCSLTDFNFGIDSSQLTKWAISHNNWETSRCLINSNQWKHGSAR